MTFPIYFPEGCPPGDATHEELCVYRYCIEQTVTENDFLSYYQLDPVKWNGKIRAYGLSVQLCKEDCIKGLQLPAIRKRFKSYASGMTYANTGVIKQTGKNPFHYTWWLYNNAKPHTYFVICA